MHLVTNAPESKPAITANNLTLTLGQGAEATAILHGVSLTVPQGQVVALLGPSGSGKSSLMALLSGLERASGGQLIVADQDFSQLDEDALARARRGRIGVVLQAFHLLPTMTALENVMTPLELAGLPDAETRAREELAAVGLTHRLTHYPTQLSGGEQQRVAIARALAPRPTLIFADEPTGNLDHATGEAIIELLFARRAESGATLVIITHDEALAARAQRIIRLSDGHIASDSLNDPHHTSENLHASHDRTS
nr:ABC transporter ATP-binding protein [Novosphingobium terrae]